MTHNSIYVLFGTFSVQLSPFGRKYSEAVELITREERAADGTLRRDISARKRRFTLSYDIIDGQQLEVFDELLMFMEPITIGIERNGGNFDTYRVLLQPYSKERLLAKGDGLWSGFTAEFVEV